MYAFTTLLTFLAIGSASVSAVPLHHRRTCKPHSRISQGSSVSTTVLESSTAVPSATVTSGILAVSTKVSSSEEASSTKVSTTESSVAASSTKASSTKAASTSKASSTKASSTKTSSTAAATSTGVVSSLLKKLFPVSHSAFWTTSTASTDALPLSDSTLGITNLLKALSHNYVKAPDGKQSMQATYPEGSYTFTHSPQGGLSFYATGPSSVSLDDAKEATFSYSVYFEDDFAFNKGGKLPGFCTCSSHTSNKLILTRDTDGGDDATTAVSCSGGRRDDTCWSTRFMWRTGGAGEAYTYLPPDYSANKAVCDVAPFSTCNDVYGASVGRGSWTFKAGTRTTIGQRVRLNDVGQENGELEIFVEGESIFTVKGLVFRDKAAGRIRGIQMQTFFGGTTFPSYCVPL